MSRDRLAERRRARENTAAQQQDQRHGQYSSGGSRGHADPLRSNYDHGYNDYQQDPGYAPPSTSPGYGAYGYGESA